MKKIDLVALSCLIPALVLIQAGCSKPSPQTPVPTYPASPHSVNPVPMPTAVLTNSGGSSTAELEAKIRLLEAENERLLAENQKFKSSLMKVQGLVSSLDFSNTLSGLNDVYVNTEALDSYVEGLPDLPEPPIAPVNIENIINTARTVRAVIADLPDLRKIPIIGLDPNVRKIEDQRYNILEMTEFLEALEDLPQFLSGAESLEELKSRIDTYLQEVKEASFSAGELLIEIQNASEIP
jgi:predicted RNase H-like HicB family nuclease